MGIRFMIGGSVGILYQIYDSALKVFYALKISSVSPCFGIIVVFLVRER